MARVQRAAWRQGDARRVSMIVAVLAIIAGTPAIACSCVPPADDAEATARAAAALAEADLAVAVEVGPQLGRTARYCSDDGKARPDLRDQTIWLTRRAKVKASVKGNAKGSLVLRDAALQIKDGMCLFIVSSCEPSIATATVLLLKRVSKTTYEAAGICSQTAFWDHYRKRRPDFFRGSERRGGIVPPR